MSSALSTVEPASREVLYPKLRIKAHDTVWVEGRECIAQSKQGDKWILVETDTGELRIISDAQALKQHGLGELKLRSRALLRSAMSPIRFDIEGEAAREAAQRKHEYVEYVLNHKDGYRASKPWIRKRIWEKADELGDENWPSAGSVINWVKLHDANYAELGLAAYAVRNDLKGKRGSRLPAPKQQALDLAIDSYLQGGSVEDAHVFAVKYIYEFNQTAEGRAFCETAPKRHLNSNGQLTPPSLSTLRRELKLKVSPFVKHAGRIGKHYAKKHGRTYQTRALPDRPYAEVEVDFTPLDVLLVAENGALLGRPHLIVFLDRATRMVLGFSLSFEVPSFAAVLEGLRHTTYRKNIGHIDGLNDEDWPCWGRPENVFIDNGREFANGHLLAAASDLGFAIHRLAPREPWLKGLVERFMRTITGLSHLFPGTTLSNSVQRRDYQNIDLPTLTLSQCRDLVTKWIVTVYNHRPNRMLGDAPGVARAPIDAWRDKLDALDVPALPNPELFIALAGERETRTVQKYGVEWDHIRYWSPELDRVLAHPEHEIRSTNTRTAKYHIRRDPFDLSKIYLYNHHANERIVVPVVDQWRQYTQNLSKHEHRLCREHESIREEQRSDPTALWKARAALIEAGKGKLKEGRRKQLERNLTRFLYGNRSRLLESTIHSETALEGGDPPIPLSSVMEAPAYIQPDKTDLKSEMGTSHSELVRPEEMLSDCGDDMDDILALAADIKSGSRDHA